MATKVETQQVDYAVENQQLVTQLTKRHEQYMHDLEKSLAKEGVDATKREQVKYTMMTQLIQAQKTGGTARQLFGTVSEQTKVIVTGGKGNESDVSPNWKLFLDGALFMGSIFMILSALSATANQLGIVTLLLNYFLAGAAMLVISKATPQYKHNTQTQQGKWKPLVIYFLMTGFAMIVWLIGMTGLMLIPTAINPVLPSEVYLVIGLATLALKFYVKRKLNIRGGAF